MNFQTFDLNLLRVFVAVYAERNVSRAAIAVGLSQPATSNALLRMRRACADPLFIRTPRGMEPTALARSMIVPIRAGLGALQGCLEQTMSFEPSRTLRTFRLLMSDAGESAVLPRLMEQLQRVSTTLTVEAVRAPHERYAELLEGGAADLAIGNLPFLEGGFHQRSLFTDPYCCIVRPDHPRIRKRLTLEQYVAAQHVSIATGSADESVEAALARHRAKRSVRLRVTHYHVAVDIVAATDMIAVVPVNATRGVGSIRVLPMPIRLAPAEVRQFWHRTAHEDPANRWLRSEIAALDFGPRSHDASRSGSGGRAHVARARA